MKQLLITVMILLSLQVGANAQRSEIFAPEGKAIKGYDPVAFFTEGKPVRGLEHFTYTWKNVQWYFSSSENLESFKASPERYEPQYGGYCAYGAAEGHKAPTETATWTLVNQKLYFNYNAKVKDAWMKKQHEYIGKADALWKELKDKE